MDKQTLSEAISNAKKYAKNLKQQVQTNNPLLKSQNSISCELSYHELTYLHTNSVNFNKTKSKVESMNYFKQKSPPKNVDKSVSNTTSKMSIPKKQVQSESQCENNLQKSQNRMQPKHLSNLFAGSLGSKELINKKNGHNHTYTHLNDLHSDKFSEIESNISTKAKINRLRHSKSPNKQRHVELNYTTEEEQIYKTKSVNYSQSPQRSKSEKKQNRMDVSKLMEQINRLQEIIKKYKFLIIQMKNKYKDMELKLDQKVMNDHYIDALKFQIQELQDKNNELNLVISKQNEKINSFELIMIDKIKKVNEYYSKYVEDRIQLQKQNELLKNLLLIAIQNTNTTFATNDGSQIKKELQNSVALQIIAKNVQIFNLKWS